MAAVILVHCLDVDRFTNWSPWQLRIFLIASFKFGTIGFFLVSGFLMGERVDRCNPFDYFSRRANKILPAWIFWFSMLVLKTVLNASVHQGLANTSVGWITRKTAAVAWSGLWNSAFWFVPNLLLCIVVLLVFRRYLYTLRLGACLLAVNLIYAFNIYGLWFPSRHTEALFAFVFYLWLGSYIAHNFEKANQLLDRISLAVSVSLAVFTCILSIAESYWLALLNNPDPVNTLRISNQLFSLAMALVLFKLKRPSWPRFVDVRRHTFGLYLSHLIVMSTYLLLLKALHDRIGTVFPVFGVDYVFGAFVVFVLTYLTCVLITESIARTPRLRWTVGLSSEKPAPQSGTNFFSSQVPSKT